METAPAGAAAVASEPMRTAASATARSRRRDRVVDGRVDRMVWGSFLTVVVSLVASCVLVDEDPVVVRVAHVDPSVRTDGDLLGLAEARDGPEDAVVGVVRAP